MIYPDDESVATYGCTSDSTLKAAMERGALRRSEEHEFLHAFLFQFEGKYHLADRGDETIYVEFDGKIIKCDFSNTSVVSGRALRYLRHLVSAKGAVKFSTEEMTVSIQGSGDEVLFRTEPFILGELEWTKSQDTITEIQQQRYATKKLGTYMWSTKVRYPAQVMMTVYFEKIQCIQGLQVPGCIDEETVSAYLEPGDRPAGADEINGNQV